MGLAPASSSDLQASQTPHVEGISGGLQCNLPLKPGPTRAGRSEQRPVWVCTLQGLGSHSLSEYLFQYLITLIMNIFFSLDLSEFPSCPLPLVLPVHTLRRIWFHPLYIFPVCSCRPAVRPSPSLLRAEDTQSPQPLLLHYMLQLPTPTALLDVCRAS